MDRETERCDRGSERDVAMGRAAHGPGHGSDGLLCAPTMPHFQVHRWLSTRRSNYFLSAESYAPGSKRFASPTPPFLSSSSPPAPLPFVCALTCVHVRSSSSSSSLAALRVPLLSTQEFLCSPVRFRAPWRIPPPSLPRCFPASFPPYASTLAHSGWVVVLAATVACCLLCSRRFGGFRYSPQMRMRTASSTTRQTPNPVSTSRRTNLWRRSHSCAKTRLFLPWTHLSRQAFPGFVRLVPVW